jgi:hypothetical protein
MKHDTDSTENKINDLRIIRYTKIEKLKHCIEDVLEWDFSKLIKDCEDGRDLRMALERLRKFYDENKYDLV